jgi:hypothetical protein
MILKLPYRPFKKLPFLTEREADVILDLGVLEDVCAELGIEFWEIKSFMEKNDYDFSSLLLWHGYLDACKEQYKRPKFTKEQSLIWYEFLSKPERDKFIKMITELFGKIVKAYKPDDKKKATARQPLRTSDPLQSVSLDGQSSGSENPV